MIEKFHFQAYLNKEKAKKSIKKMIKDFSDYNIINFNIKSKNSEIKKLENIERIFYENDVSIKIELKDPNIRMDENNYATLNIILNEYEKEHYVLTVQSNIFATKKILFAGYNSEIEKKLKKYSIE